VTRTIGVSLPRLTAEQKDRYLELAVFREDVAIPARYWPGTGTPPAAGQRLLSGGTVNA
jgi:hypothetical protein